MALLQKFFTNTIESKFIKNLICNTPLPLCDSVKDGDIIYKGYNYIYKDNVICCKESGVLDRNNFDIICSYNIGEHKVGITQPLVNKDVYYDAFTHKYLGNYLRLIRDVYDINLMPYYNCFNYAIVGDALIEKKYNYVKKIIRETITWSLEWYYSGDVIDINNNYRQYTINDEPAEIISIMTDASPILGLKSKSWEMVYHTNTILWKCNDTSIPPSSPITLIITYEEPIVQGLVGDYTYKVTTDNNPSYKVLAIPVKFNRDYTIAVDNPLTTLLCPMIYDELGLVQLDNKNISDYVSIDKYEVEGSRFKQPFKVHIGMKTDDIITPEKLYAYQDYLYLLIQMPITNTSSIVVLEGDFTSPCTHITGEGYLYEYSPLTLLEVNDKQSYAFSNRLVEYLSNNIITQYDEFYGDIQYLQKLLDKNPTGIWEDDLRVEVFEKCLNDNMSIKRGLYDINGYMNKDVEKILSRNFSKGVDNI